MKTDTPMENQTYPMWAAQFERSFYEIVLGQGKPTPYVIPGLVQTFLRAQRALAPQKQEWRELFDLIAKVHAFKLLATLSAELDHSPSVIDRYYRYVFDSLIDEIATLSNRSVPFDFDPYMDGLIKDIAELIETIDDFEFERVNLYRVLWSRLLTSTKWREDERERLKVLGTQTTNLENIALAHHSFLIRRDKETIGYIKELGVSALPLLFYWIEELAQQGDVKRCGEYVDFLSQNLRPALTRMGNHRSARDFTRHVLRTTTPYFRAGGNEDHYERMLTQSLPYSFIEYEDFLFMKSQYDKWAELYTYANFDSFSVPNDKLKIVQKEAPEVLLPILHQAVAQLIEQKNRPSYKQAVRLLKKLRTVYKKLKRVPEWETFMQKLIAKYKRLRAFNEECVRGKLVN
ncbi:SWIM zinc finger family protein [Bacillus sp. B15-48]|uniref:SWIM zinc finger family protein n=1 Tax=Bacillus sp. B15-48 TaxID=1548601 RepID=UPI001EF26564|nr:SWIM zinc finger family protein [Bacillus sp. B15-48]